MWGMENSKKKLPKRLTPCRSNVKRNVLDQLGGHASESLPKEHQHPRRVPKPPRRVVVTPRGNFRFVLPNSPSCGAFQSQAEQSQKGVPTVIISTTKNKKDISHPAMTTSATTSTASPLVPLEVYEKYEPKTGVFQGISGFPTSSERAGGDDPSVGRTPSFRPTTGTERPSSNKTGGRRRTSVSRSASGIPVPRGADRSGRKSRLAAAVGGRATSPEVPRGAPDAETGTGEAPSRSGPEDGATAVPPELRTLLVSLAEAEEALGRVEQEEARLRLRRAEGLRALAELCCPRPPLGRRGPSPRGGNKENRAPPSVAKYARLRAAFPGLQTPAGPGRERSAAAVQSTPARLSNAVMEQLRSLFDDRDGEA